MVVPFIMGTKALNNPTPSKGRCDNISLNFSYIGINSDYFDYHSYEIEIENTGDECVFHSLYQDYDDENRLSIDNKNNDSLFSGEMFKPSEHHTVVVNSKNEITDWSNYHFYVQKLDIPDEGVTYSDLHLEKTSTSSSASTYYLRGEINNRAGNYYYGYIADISYKGNDYSVYFSDKGITAKEDLDLEQLTINNLKAYRSSYKMDDRQQYLFLRYGIIVFFVVPLFLPFIIILIVQLVKFIKRKKAS